MSYDKYTSIHHLTEQGWIHSEQRPDGAIETWLCKKDQASGFSKEYRDWSCEWASPKFSREKRDGIRAMFAASVGLVEGRSGNIITTVTIPR